jgi:hypothetical protein
VPSISFHYPYWVTTDLLRERYGVKPPASKRKMLLLSVVGVTALTAGVAVITALTFNPVQYQDLSFRTGPLSTEVEFEVTKDPQSTVVCELQALSEQFAIVGYRVVELGPTQAATNRYTVTINTTHEATTGLVSGCRLK